MKQMKQRIRRMEILLGIVFIVIAVLIGTAKKKAHQALVSLEKTNNPCLSYEAWIDIHEPEFQNSGDAQSAYYKYAEEQYSPEYREAEKKTGPIQGGGDNLTPYRSDIINQTNLMFHTILYET